MESLERNRKISSFIIHLSLVLISITMLIPFLWMVLTAFKSITEATSVNPFIIFPKVWRTDAFKAVLPTWISFCSIEIPCF